MLLRNSLWNLGGSALPMAVALATVPLMIHALGTEGYGVVTLVGAVIGSIWLFAKGRDKATPIPFGPYLAIAGWISFMWGKDLVGMYMRFAGLA